MNKFLIFTMIVGIVMLSLDNYQVEAAEATEAAQQNMHRMEDEAATKAVAEEMIKMNDNGDGGKK